ncbi:site-specific DNA-methyltransferase [Candidatus Omnitrophota bacterium]
MAVLNFKGKTFVQNHHLAVPYHQLIPKKDKSLTDRASLNDNLIIHGDNLKALKALLPNYAGKVKCIYIDPPYNTGNEKWIYSDNVNSPMMQEWLGKVVDKDVLTRHDRWLCMMTPRLKLLKELLSEDGSIFVSIDDNEQHRLRMLMDEIFGDHNFVECFIWKSRLGKGATAQETAKLHEYILCYAKNISLINFKTDRRITDKDAKERLRQWGQGDRREDRPTMYYPIISKEFGKVYPKKPDGTDGRWRMRKEKIEELIQKNLVIFEKQDDGRIEAYRIILSGSETNTAFSSILKSEIVKTTAHGSIELKEIFGKQVMDYPKPSRLIKELISLSTYADKDAVILDSFSGSGTTAHAVLGLNKEDDGNRKFILVECENYADKITAERIRRVIKGVKNARNMHLQKGLKGTFSYFELGDPIEMESILEGNKLPSYLDLARYVFYTATGEEFDSKKVKEKKHFIGESKEYEVHLFYKPDIEYLKSTALTLEAAKSLGPFKKKKRIVFAPSKYLDTDYLLEYRIDYCQLPFEIYRLKE